MQTIQLSTYEVYTEFGYSVYFGRHYFLEEQGVTFAQLLLCQKANYELLCLLNDLLRFGLQQFFFWFLSCLKQLMQSNSIIQIVLGFQKLDNNELFSLWNVKIIKLQTLIYKAKIMITKNLNIQPAQLINQKRPLSPKFGCTYGLKTPQNDRQVLLDQIINNCQRAESPINRPNLPISKFNKRSSNLARFQTGSNVDRQERQKQNRINQNSYSRQRQMQRIRSSLEKRQSYASKLQGNDVQLSDAKDKKFSLTNSNHTNYLMNHNMNPSNMNKNSFQNSNHFEYQTAQQYFPKRYSPLKNILNSPNHRFKSHVPVDIPTPKRPDSKNSQRNDSTRLQQIGHLNSSQETLMRERIEQYKLKHIQNCKKEQRKLRIYYVQLQNKLCQIRNKQLKMLAQYESQKLKQLDECLKELVKHSPISTKIEDCQTKLNQIKNRRELRINEQVVPEIKGCLINDVSGVYFSFDQRNN